MIVGAGVIGLACAWRAAQGGLRVRVIERAEPGSGASGVAAGMLAPVGEATWGEEALLDAALASHGMWDSFAEELADAGEAQSSLLRNGALHVALDADEAARVATAVRADGLPRARRVVALRKRVPPSSSPASVPRRSPERTRRTKRAWIRSRSSPRSGVHATGRASRSPPARSVTGALHDGDAVRGVVTEDGEEHPAEATVVAAGAWSGSLAWLPTRGAAARAPGQGPDPDAARRARRSGRREDRRVRARLPRPARGRPPDRGGDRRGDGLRHPRYRGRASSSFCARPTGRFRTPPSSSSSGSSRACAPARRTTRRSSGRAASRAWSTRPATSGTGSSSLR